MSNSFSINFTMSDIEKLQERIQNVDDGEQEIVFEWIIFDDVGNIEHLKITVGDDEQAKVLLDYQRR